MEHPNQVKHDDTILGFLLGAFALLCLFTFIVLFGMV